MNKYITLLALLAFAGIVNAQCATNASGNAGSCLCSQGYYGSNAEVGGNCQQCPTGTTTATPSNASTGNTYSSVNASVCSSCLANFYMSATANTSSPSAATCVACTGGSGNSSGPTSQGDASQCNTCQANYYMTALAVSASGSTSAASASCTACPVNSYSSAQSSVGSITQCSCFDSNAVTLSAAVNACVCQNGYSGTVATTQGAASGCSQCSSGQFSSSGSACASCAAGSTISSDQGSCVCNDSSTGTTTWSISTNVCQCQANFYGDPTTAAAGATGSCTSCPNGETSLSGTISVDGCSNVNTTSSKIIGISVLAFLIVSMI